MSPADVHRAHGVEVLDVLAGEGVVVDDVVIGLLAAAPEGAVAVYEQPDDPGDVPIGSLWIDTDSVVGEEAEEVSDE